MLFVATLDLDHHKWSLAKQNITKMNLTLNYTVFEWSEKEWCKNSQKYNVNQKLSMSVWLFVKDYRIKDSKSRFDNSEFPCILAAIHMKVAATFFVQNQTNCIVYMVTSMFSIKFGKNFDPVFVFVLDLFLFSTLYSYFTRFLCFLIMWFHAEM